VEEVAAVSASDIVAVERCVANGTVFSKVDKVVAAANRTDGAVVGLAFNWNWCMLPTEGEVVDYMRT